MTPPSPHSSSSGERTEPEPERARSPRYNVRSDTVLEMCSDIEDISFIDEDPEDEISEITRDEETEDEVTEDRESVCDENSNIDKQQIVIKLNNEIELTSIVVNARPLPGQGKEMSVDEEESQSPECRQNGEHERAGYINQVDPTYDEISETSFNIGYEPLGLRAPIATSSSSSSETVSSHGPGSVVMKRRSVLVRQSKLDTGDAEHPDMTRTRHSWVTGHTSYKPSQV